MDNSKIRGPLFAGLAAILFAMNIIVNKIGLTQNITAVSYNILMGIVAGMLSIVPILKKLSIIRPLKRKSWLQLLAIGVLTSGLANFTLLWGQTLTQVTNVGFLMSLASFFTLVFAFFMLGEKLSKKKYIWAFILSIGTYLLIVGTGTLKLNYGDFLILFTAAVVGYTNTLAKFPMKIIGGGNVAYLRLLIGMVFLILLIPLAAPDILSSITSIRPWYIFSGILMWGVVVFFYKAIEYAGPSIATLVLVSYPLLSAVGAAIILNEVVAINQIVGGLIILYSIYNISKS